MIAISPATNPPVQIVENPFCLLPRDLIMEIIKQLDIPSEAMLHHVNRQFRALAMNYQKVVCVGAAYHGYLKVLKWARERNFSWGEKEDSRPLSQFYGSIRFPSFLLFRQLDTCSSAALSGQLEILKAAKRNGCPWTKDTTTNAAIAGHLEVFSWAVQNGCPTSNDILYEAYFFKQSKFVQDSVKVYPWNPEISYIAACKGDLPFLKWMKTANKMRDERICSGAASGGHFEVLQWAKNEHFPWDETCASAAASGHLGILIWAREQGCPWGKDIGKKAAVRGQLEVVQWIHANGLPFTSSVYLDCLDKDICYFEIVQKKLVSIYNWAYNEAHLPFPENLIEKLVSFGCMQLLEWVISIGHPQVEGLCTLAASKGNLKLLQWAREKKLPWDKKTTLAAVWNAETFLWAVENGCPWDDTVFEQVEAQDNVAQLKWLAKQVKQMAQIAISRLSKKQSLAELQQMHAEGIPAKFLICKETIFEGRIEILEWAVSVKAELPPHLCAYAAAVNNLTILQFLRAHGAPYDPFTCINAIAGGHMDLLKWAHADGAPLHVLLLSLLTQSIKVSHFEVIKWALQNNAPWSEPFKQSAVQCFNREPPVPNWEAELIFNPDNQVEELTRDEFFELMEKEFPDYMFQSLEAAAEACTLI